MEPVQAYAFEPILSEPREVPDSDSSDSEEGNDSAAEASNDPHSRTQDRRWCVCTMCDLMPLLDECLCCHEVAGAMNTIINDDLKCITEHETFIVLCTREDVLEGALRLMADLKVETLMQPISMK